jgi:MATE family multidrug resistance protein
MTEIYATSREFNAASEARHIFASGSNLAVNQVGQILIPVVDLVMISWLGTHALAASNLINSVGLLLYLTSFGILQGVIPVAGAAMGAGRRHDVGAASRAALIIGLVLGVATTVIMGGLPAILGHLGQAEDVTELSTAYVHALLPGYVPSLLFVTIRFLLVALNDLRWLNPIVVVGVLVKISLNYILMFGLAGFAARGVAGIGTSTVVVNWLMLLLAGLALFGTGRNRDAIKQTIMSGPISQWLMAILSVGMPTGVILFTETMLFTGSTMLMGGLGPTQLAAHGVVLLWLNIALMVPVGISQAAVSRVAFLMGCGSIDGLKHAARASVWVTIAVSIVIGAVFVAVPRLMVNLLLWENPNVALDGVVDAAVPLMQVAAIVQLLAGLVIVEAGILRGLRDMASSIWIIAFSYWAMGIGSAWTAGILLGYGAVGIWVGIAIGFSVSLATLHFRYQRCLDNLQCQPKDGGQQ